MRLSSAAEAADGLVDRVGDLALVCTRDLDEQPALAARQVRNRPAVVAHDVDDAGVETFTSRRREVEQSRYVVSGLGHRAVAEHEHQTVRWILDQPNRRRCERRERALGASHEGGDVEAVLRQQVLEAVARHLSAERPELGTNDAEVVGDDCLETFEHRGHRLVSAESEPLPRCRHGVERDDIVGGPAVRQRTRATRVVADHPADRAPGVGRRVGSEAQTLSRGRSLQDGVHRARIDARRTGLDVDLVHTVEVAREVEHDTGADGVAGDRGAGPAGGQRRTGRPARVDRRQHLLDGSRTYDDLRNDAIERRVGAVERTRQRESSTSSTPRRRNSATMPADVSMFGRRPTAVQRRSRARARRRSASRVSPELDRLVEDLRHVVLGDLDRRRRQETLLLHRALDERVDVALAESHSADARGDADVAHQLGQHLREGSRRRRRAVSHREPAARPHVRDDPARHRT